MHITSEVKVTSKQSDSSQDMDEILLATAQNAMSPVSSNLVEIVNNPDIIEIVFVQAGTITDTFVVSNVFVRHFRLSCSPPLTFLRSLD